MEQVVAKFEILDSFNISRFGLVILGRIISGELKSGDLIRFDENGKTHHLKVSNIDFAAVKNRSEELIALSFVYDNDEQKQFYNILKIPSQITEIKLGD